MNWKEIIRDKTLVNEDLIVKARNGDEKAKDLLFTNNLPFVRKMARRWRQRGSTIELEDLTSIGCLALVKSYNSYDLDSGFKFVTLLGKVILNEYSIAARHQSSKKFMKYQTISLDQYDDNEQESSLHDSVTDGKYINNDNYFVNGEDNTDKRLYLFNKIASRREKELLHRHYIEKETLTLIANDWGISRQAVSLLHRKCISKIRNVGDVKISV